MTGYRAGRPHFRITKTSEAACVQDAVSECPAAARHRFRGGYHGVIDSVGPAGAEFARALPITRGVALARKCARLGADCGLLAH